MPALPVEYGEHAGRERAQLGAGSLRTELDWWTRTLSGWPSELDLPVDREHPDQPADGLHHLTVAVEPDTVRGARALATACRTTEFAVYLAAYAAALAAECSQHRVLVGVPFGTRTEEELESVIGPFVNLLPVPVDVSAAPTARALVEAVGNTLLDAHEHVRVPFSHLVAEVGHPRARRAPLVQATTQIAYLPDIDGRSDGLRVSAFGLPPLATGSELDLAVLRRPDHVVLGMTARSDLFDLGSTFRMADRVVRCAERLVRRPDQPPLEPGKPT